jgi:hypothetical protein
VRERRGNVGRRASGIADSVAAAVRRRQQARDPRILLYDATGEPRLLKRDAAGHDELLATAELLVELVAEGLEPSGPGEGGPEPERSTGEPA